MAAIGVFFAEGFEEVEALTTVDLCRRAGIETCMVSVAGDKTVTGAHGIGFLMDKGIDELDFDKLDMIVLPGGMPGTKNLEQCGRLMEELDRFYEQGKYVAAICAAPTIFAHRGYLEGRTATCYPGMEAGLAGVDWTRAGAVTDGRVITGRGVGCAIAFALQIVEALVSAQAAGKLSDSIVYER